MKEIMKELSLVEFNTSFDANKEEEKSLNIQQLTYKTKTRFLGTLSCLKSENGEFNQIMIGGISSEENGKTYPTIEIINSKGIEKVNSLEKTTFIDIPRWGHSSVVYEDLIVLIGGCDHQYMFNDVHFFDYKQKIIKKVETTGTPMSHRLGHRSNLYKNFILTFGGQSFVSRGKYNYFNDLHSLNLKSMEWSKVETKGETPKPTSQHASIIYEKYLFIIGGTDGSKLLNDFHCLDLDSLIWKRIEFEGIPNPISVQSESIYPSQISAVLIKNQIIVYGLCETKVSILDLKSRKCLVTKQLLNYGSKQSLGDFKNNEGVIWCEKDSRLQCFYLNLK
jgi:hypothetical protein